MAAPRKESGKANVNVRGRSDVKFELVSERCTCLTAMRTFHSFSLCRMLQDPRLLPSSFLIHIISLQRHVADNFSSLSTHKMSTQDQRYQPVSPKPPPAAESSYQPTSPSQPASKRLCRSISPVFDMPASPGSYKPVSPAHEPNAPAYEPVSPVFDRPTSAYRPTSPYRPRSPIHDASIRPTSASISMEGPRRAANAPLQVNNEARF